MSNSPEEVLIAHQQHLADLSQELLDKIINHSEETYRPADDFTKVYSSSLLANARDISYVADYRHRLYVLLTQQNTAVFNDLNRQQFLFMLAMLNSIASESWAKTLTATNFLPPFPGSESLFLSATTKQFIFGKILELDLVNHEVITHLQTHMAKTGGLSYQHKAHYFQDINPSRSEMQRGYLTQDIASQLFEEGIAPYASADEAYSKAYQPITTSAYRQPQVALLVPIAKLNELELAYQPAEILVSDDVNTINEKLAAHDQADIQAKIWILMRLSLTTITEFQSQDIEGILHSPDLRARIHDLIARFANYQDVNLPPFVQALQEISDRIEAYRLIERSIQKQTHAAPVETSAPAISQFTTHKDIREAAPTLLNLCNKISLAVVREGYALYKSDTDPKLMSTEARDLSLQHHQGFICYNDAVYFVRPGEAEITTVDTPKKELIQGITASQVIHQLRFTSESEYQAIHAEKVIQGSPPVLISPVIAIKKHAQMISTICHEGMNRSQCSYAYVAKMQARGSNLRLQVQGAESGFLPYQAFTDIDDESIYGYLHGKILPYGNNGEWLHDNFYKSLGRFKAKRDGAQVFQNSYLNPKEDLLLLEQKDKLESARQSCRLSYQEQLSHMIHAAAEGQNQSLLLFMRAGKIIGKLINDLIDKLYPDVDSLARHNIRQHLRLVCSYSGDSISRAGGPDEINARKQAPLAKSLSLDFLPREDEITRNYLNARVHLKRTFDEYASYFYLDDELLADVQHELNTDDSILTQKQEILHHLETNLSACVDYWTMGQNVLKTGWQQRLFSCLTKGFNIDSASVHEQVTTYLAHRIALIQSIPGYNPELIAQAVQVLNFWQELSHYPNVGTYLAHFEPSPAAVASEAEEDDLFANQQNVLPAPAPRVLIQAYLKTFTHLPETKNSTLIQFMAAHFDDLDGIKQMAMARQHRNASKFNGFWFAGRNTTIVQAMYDEIVKRGDAFAFDQAFLTFLENLKPARPKAEVNNEDARTALLDFATSMQNNLRGSSGMAKIVEMIHAQEGFNVAEVVLQMRSIAKARQQRVWSKLSIFGKGRDTEIIQPLYDLMARPDFNLDANGIRDLNHILERLPHPAPRVV